MKYKYDIYTCNNGNPTAIIANCKNEKKYERIAQEIYKKHPNVDQVAVILNITKESCTFQLVNGEFCGNACLSVGAYIHEHYKIKNGTIINKIMDENNLSKLIEIKSKYDGEKGNLLIPKVLLLEDNKHEETGSYIVKMNGIIHTIIPQTFGNKNEEYAIKEIEKIKKKITTDVLGIIFLENGKIDPFIWIKRINLLQHQNSCLSGSIATLEYLYNKEGINEKRIIQPTGEAYDIKFKEKYIDITGTIRKIDTGIVEVEENDN